MAVIKRRAVHEMDANELTKRLSELRLELAKEKAHSAIGAAVSNPGKIKEMKHAIARLLTEITSRKRRL